MATKLASIFVDISANSAKFAKELGKVERDTRRWRRSVTRDIANVGRRFAVLGTVAAGGLAILTRASMKNIDSLGKTADKLGTTTEGLAGLRFAAEQTGVKVETLDMALQRMTRRMAEAAKGTGEAKGAIEELGLDAVALSAAGPEEAMRAIADALLKVENRSDKLRLAFKLFDSEGVAIVNTLSRGREGLDAFQDEADALGLALNRVDVKKVEMANDAMNRAKKISVGLGNAIAVQVSPFIGAMADALTDAATKSEGFGNLASEAMAKVGAFAQFVSDAILGISVAFDSIAIGAQSIINWLDRVQLKVRAAGEGTNSFLNGLLTDRMRGGPQPAVSAAQQAIIDEQERLLADQASLDNRRSDLQFKILERLNNFDGPLVERLRLITEAWQAEAEAATNNKPIAGGNAPLVDSSASFGAAASAASNTASLYTDLIEKLELARDKQEAFREGGEKLVDLAVIRNQAEQAYATEVERAKSAYDKWFAAEKKTNAALKRDSQAFLQFMQQINDGMPITVEAIEELLLATWQTEQGLADLRDQAEETTDTMSEYAKQAARNMQDAFADFLFDPFENGLKGMLKSFVDTIRRMLANQAASRFFSFLGKQEGGFIGGLGKLFGFAQGGSFQVGGTGGTDSQLVAFKASPDETVTITPPGMNNLGTRSSVVNINNHIDARGATRELIDILPDILEQQNQRTKAEIFDMMNRGLSPA